MIKKINNIIFSFTLSSIGMTTDIANGGDGLNDASLSILPTYSSSKVSNPIWSSAVSETIQKLPTIFNSLREEKSNEK